MSKKANPTLVGGFVLGALALAVAAIMAFGSGDLFTKHVKFAVFFDSSVSGLWVGAPVSFRGVQIGEVGKIKAVFDQESEDIKILVYFKITPSLIADAGTAAQNDPYAGANYLIQRGLRAKLQMVSFVTGQLYIDLDFYPNTPIRLMSLQNEVPEFPAVPSSLQELEIRAREALESIRSLPLDELAKAILSAVEGIESVVTSEDIAEILSGVREIVNSPEIIDTVRQLSVAVEEARTLIRDTDGEIRSIGDNVDQATVEAVELLDQGERTLAEAEAALETMRNAVGERSELRYNAERTLDELAAAARSIRLLAEYLELHPEALVAGKPDSARP